MIHGIDISQHQAGINVSAAGVGFCMVKATEGEGFVDPEFHRNTASVRAAGVPAGFYHMARPTPDNDPVREAEHFLRTIAPLLRPTDVLALDWEKENPHNTAWADRFVDTVMAAHPGRTVWLYTYLWIANASYSWSRMKARVPLWLAHYNPTRGSAPGWTVAAWQYTETGTVPGWPRGVDLNEIYSLRRDGMPEFTLPTSRPITQSWGMEFFWLKGIYYPGGFYKSLGWLGHNGLDFGCHIGDPVESVCDGVVEFVGSTHGHPLLSGGGLGILIRNDEVGVKFEYLHLSQTNVYPGQRVKAWQVIGLAGNTGVSTAPHLHLGAIPVHGLNIHNGYRGRIDPTPYLYGSINPAGGAVGPIKEEDMGLSADDKLWISQKLYAITDDKNVLNRLRDNILDKKGLGDIAVAASDPVLKALKEHSQALYDAVKEIPGVDTKALEPIIAAHVKRIEALQLQVTVTPEMPKEGEQA